MTCCCSLAGTAACRACPNNPFADLTHTGFNTYDYGSYEYIYNRIDEKNKANPIIQYWCGNCDSILTPHQKYCHNCGKQIDWEQILREEE